MAQKSMYQQVIAELEKSSGNDTPDYVGFLGHAYAKSGRRAEAQKVLDRLKRLSRQTYVSPFFVAIVYAGLVEKDRAFELQEKAYEERAEDLALLKAHPLLDDLRADPRFAALLKRMSLL